jgi:asparagine synthetase B (glutamine-hydrolysing)
MLIFSKKGQGRCAIVMCLFFMYVYKWEYLKRRNNLCTYDKNLVDDIFDSFVKGNEERLTISNDSVKKVATLSGGLDSRFIAYVNKKSNLELKVLMFIFE